MDKKQTEKSVEVMEAYTKGAQIEYCRKNDFNGIYHIAFNPLWDWDNYDYRINKYRPFKSIEEAWNTMLLHEPFGWVKSKFSDDNFTYEHISYLDNSMCVIGADSIDGSTCQKYEKYFDEYTFVDGTPFGIKEE